MSAALCSARAPRFLSPRTPPSSRAYAVPGVAVLPGYLGYLSGYLGYLEQGTRGSGSTDQSATQAHTVCRNGIIGALLETVRV
eukprot:1675410-Rhodomonas_salina.1